MKKVILASVLAASAATMMTNANAAASQTFCVSGTTTGGTAATSSTTGQDFIKVAFVAKCSANTHVAGEDGGTYYRVGSSSSKGKTRFAGGTAGGGVVAAGACAVPTLCASTDAVSAMQSTYAPTS